MGTGTLGTWELLLLAVGEALQSPEDCGRQAGQGQGDFCGVTLPRPHQPLALEEPPVPASVC